MIWQSKLVRVLQTIQRFLIIKIRTTKYSKRVQHVWVEIFPVSRSKKRFKYCIIFDLIPFL